MSFFLLEPEVAGGLGDNAILDSTVHPPHVTRLHYAIDDWHGDELLESTPCFIITQELGDKLVEAELTGFELADAEVTLSETGIELLGNTELPKFRWFKVPGTAGTDDFGLTSDATLIASARALESLRTGDISGCDIEEWQHGPTED